MANVQEQQSELTGQQPALTQTQNPEQDVLQEIQQPQQQQQQTQQPTVYENFMSMNPAQLREFQGNLHRLKQKNEVLINSGDARLEEYESEIEAGNMTWNQAVKISKKDLSPVSRSLDNIYYNKGKEL
jgi:hypothetical protein